MKQKVELISNSSEKLISSQINKMIKEGKVIEQIVPVSKTSFIVIFKEAEEAEQP